MKKPLDVTPVAQKTAVNHQRYVFIKTHGPAKATRINEFERERLEKVIVNGRPYGR